MEQLFYVFFRRYLIRVIGKYSRYFYYRVIMKPRTIESLSNVLKEDNEDVGNSLKQDFLNAFVGSIVLILLSIFIAWLIWH